MEYEIGVTAKVKIRPFARAYHLTTLKGEREGVPVKNREGKKLRKRQLDIILDGVVSRYNNWWNETTNELKVNRHKPIWILGGDFNCLPDSDEINKVKDDGFLSGRIPIFWVN